MDLRWFVITAVIEIAASQDFAAIFKKYKNLKHRPCVTLKGKFGICVSAKVCQRQVLNIINVADFLCYDGKVNNMVCCSPDEIKLFSWIPFAKSNTIISKQKPVANFFTDVGLMDSQRDVSDALAVTETHDDEYSEDIIDILVKIIAIIIIPDVFWSKHPQVGPVNFLSDKDYSSLQVEEMVSTAAPKSESIASTASLSDGSSFSSQDASSTSASTANPGTEFSVSTSDSDVNKSKTPEMETSVSDSISSEVSTTPSIPKVSATSASLPTSSTPKPIENDYATEFPKPPVCGVSNGVFSRVVGGTNANLGDFPWMALIAYNVTGGFMFKCGASLITSQHALTAAHCIHGMQDQLFFVRLGELDISDHNITRPVDFIIKKSIIHENYNTKHGTDDIAVLVFHRRVRFTDLIKPICLPLNEKIRSNNFVDYRPFIAGWGNTKYQGPRATRLQVLQLPVVTEEVCRKAYESLKVLIIDGRVICAGGQGGVDACNGDSGGPLMQPIYDSTNYTTCFYQTGIVSFGMKCGTPGYPSVYTRVTEYIEWLQKHVLGITST